MFMSMPYVRLNISRMKQFEIRFCFNIAGAPNSDFTVDFEDDF